MAEPKLTFEQANDIVKRITYKPGWRFQLEAETPYASFYVDFAILRITYKAPDRDYPFSDTLVMCMERLPLYDTETFLRYLFGAIEKSERHEMLEFFRVDGKLYCDPHDKENWRGMSMPNYPDFSKSIEVKA